LKASIVRRVEKLEQQIEPLEPEVPPLDFDLLTEAEQFYFTREMRLLRTKARELGYGDGPEGNIHSLGWFDLGHFDPVSNEEVRMECLEALDEKEREVIETLGEIMGKGFRLTTVLSEAEKVQIKKYNEVVRFFGNNLVMELAKKGRIEGFTEQDLLDSRLQYGKIMAKYGEKNFEQ